MVDGLVVEQCEYRRDPRPARTGTVSRDDAPVPCCLSAEPRRAWRRLLVVVVSRASLRDQSAPPRSTAKKSRDGIFSRYNIRRHCGFASESRTPRSAAAGPARPWRPSCAASAAVRRTSKGGAFAPSRSRRWARRFRAKRELPGQLAAYATTMTGDADSNPIPNIITTGAVRRRRRPHVRVQRGSVRGR